MANMDATKVAVEPKANKVALAGWAIMLAGSALWIYGYFVTGHPSIIAWHDYAPHWIAEFLPNLESEIGMVLCFAGMIPMYWPTRN